MAALRESTTVVPMDHRVMGVIGASGGLGVSTLAVALAVRAGPHVGASVCVDGEPGTGGLDVTACIEHLPGLRWSDLAASLGQVDGAALLRALPCEGAARVLAALDTAVPAEVVSAAVRGLREVCGLTVIDLGRSAALMQECTDLVLVSGTSARGLADATAMLRRLGGWVGTPRLVLRLARGDGISPEEVAVHLDLPLAGVYPDDGRATSDAARARVPGSRSSGSVTQVADRLLRECGLVVEPGPGQLAERRSA